MTDTQKSDLIDRVHHEHNHLTRLFEDLGATFEKIAEGECDRETLESAREDLRIGLEDMLHHFDQEEEVFFVEIERRFPEFADQIAELVDTHEFVCDRTRWLHTVLSRDDDAIAELGDEVHGVLETLSKTLVDHTAQENEIFGAALRQMTPAEREALLREMQRI